MTPRRALRLAVPALLVVAAVIAIRLFAGGSTVERDGLTFATGDLAKSLDRETDATGTRTVAKFADSTGVPCRAFMGSDVSGIACRERGGWHMRVIRDGISLDDPAAIARTEAALRESAAAIVAQ
jgi:hypothetical protein